MSKGSRLERISGCPGPNVYMNTYTSYYHKNKADNYHPDKYTLAATVESINANGQYDSKGILVCVLPPINFLLTANNKPLEKKEQLSA